MTQDEIIEMAIQLGFDERLSNNWLVSEDALGRFAKMVAAKEREACAKVCEDDAWRCKKIAVDTQNKQANASAIEASICASAIRARGQA